jgi:hypothetical protein
MVLVVVQNRTVYNIWNNWEVVKRREQIQMNMKYRYKINK